MKLACFVCSCLLIAVPVFGQSRRSSRPPIFLGLPKGLSLGKTGHEAFAARGSAPPQTSGLNFAAAASYLSGGRAAEGVTVADLNGDGKPDIVVSNVDGTVGVLIGNGDGTFQAAVTYESGGVSVGVAVADVNGDGRPDIVVANGGVGVLLGNGDGTFQPPVNYAAGFQSVAVAVADVNGDGKPDLAVVTCITSGCENDGAAVLLGNGDGTFQAALIYGSGGGVFAGSLAVGDINGDGKPDIVIANSYSSGTNQNGDLAVLLGNGDGTFRTAVTYPSGGYEATSVALADVNGDGKADLLVSNCGTIGDSTCANGTVAVLFGNGDGTFQPAVTYDSGGFGAISVGLADVNGDDKLDIVVANECASQGNCLDEPVGVLLGNGDGTFQTVVTYDSGGFTSVSISVGDVNGDGKPDLVVSNGCSDGNCISGSVSVLINTSLPATETALLSSLNPSPFGQAVTLTASVTGIKDKGVPTGPVNFLDGAQSLGSSSLNPAGIATLSTSTLAVGTHSITAMYGGDTNFGSSTSPVLSQVVQGAIVQLNPTSVNFGNVTVGGNGVKQGILVNLQNTGNATLTISSMGITGADRADFIQEGVCPSSMAPGALCTVTLQFVPTTTGTRAAALSVTDNAPNSPQTVSLTGVGVLPAVDLSPASLSFPTQVVFTSSKAQPVTLTNTGLGYLFITKIAMTGQFTQTNNCGSTVKPGNSCTLNVTFRPTKSGTITGALSITDNAPLSPQTVSLEGTGTNIQLTPASVNFGNQPVGTKSLPKKITLSNKGSVAVSITKISVTGANAGDFAQTNTCGAIVAAGASCAITVTFTPLAKGARTASVSFIDNGGGSPQRVTLTGTGT